MWNFDQEKTKLRIKELNEYYKEHGLNAFGFKCEKKQNCVQSQKGKTVKQFHGSTASVTPLYDAVYNNMPIRILFIGKETAYMKKLNNGYGIPENFDANNKIALKWIDSKKRNSHIEGTRLILRNIYNVESDYVYSSYALSNLLRCSFQDEDKRYKASSTRDTKEMRDNCVVHLIEEIKILKPTIIITQGAWAVSGRRTFIDILTDRFGKYDLLKKNKNEKYGLYRFGTFYCVTTHHPGRLAVWKKNLANDSVWPMIDYMRNKEKCLPSEKMSVSAYENSVKRFIDPIISTLKSNDSLR